MTRLEFLQRNIAQVFHSCLLGSGVKVTERELPAYAAKLTARLWYALKREAVKRRR